MSIEVRSSMTLEELYKEHNERMKAEPKTEPKTERAIRLETTGKDDEKRYKVIDCPMLFRPGEVRLVCGEEAQDEE